MLNNPKYKKTIFLCARRAMLENELILKKFATEFVPNNYTIEELDPLNDFLEKIYDNDLYDVVMGTKTAEDYANLYNIIFLKDIEQFASKARKIGKKLIDEY